MFNTYTPTYMFVELYTVYNVYKMNVNCLYKLLYTHVHMCVYVIDTMHIYTSTHIYMNIYMHMCIYIYIQKTYIKIIMCMHMWYICSMVYVHNAQTNTKFYWSSHLIAFSNQGHRTLRLLSICSATDLCYSVPVDFKYNVQARHQKEH